jgi:hypothetical protein
MFIHETNLRKKAFEKLYNLTESEEQHNGIHKYCMVALGLLTILFSKIAG